MSGYYPPGVTGNEPEISGIWPIEVVVDEAATEVRRLERGLSDLLGVLEDQVPLKGSLGKSATAAVDALDELRDAIEALLPEEDYE